MPCMDRDVKKPRKKKKVLPRLHVRLMANEVTNPPHLGLTSGINYTSSMSARQHEAGAADGTAAL